MSKPCVMTVLHPSWRERLLPWLQTIGVDAVVVADPAADAAGRTQANSTLDADSWWDGRQMHLAPNPRHLAFDWLYVTAHWAVANEERRYLVDLGLPDLKGSLLTTAEEYARVVTLGTAKRAGARAPTVWRLAGFWERTRASRVAHAKGVPLSDVVDWHLRNVDADLDLCQSLTLKWGVPAPPSLWDTLTLPSRDPRTVRLN